VRRIFLFVLTALIPICGLSQQERWVYRYSGVNIWRNEWANSVVYGDDSNIYAAGKSWHYGTGDDFTLVSLTNAGAEHWIYTHNGLADSYDEACSIAYGADNNLYVAGFSYGNDTTHDFTVISVSPDGEERWVYKHSGSGRGYDYAYDIIYGTDGNIYAAGSSWNTGTNSDFTAISLTTDGAERWVYDYNGPGSYNDCARAIVYGSDGNIYVVGETYGSGSFDDFTVISLNRDGKERWVYRYNGPGNWADYAFSVVDGSDSSIFVTGSSAGYYSVDLTVISLAYSGNERWVYRHTDYYDDYGVAGVYGTDGNIYAAGYLGSDVPDLLVASVTDSGTSRWEYVYYTPAITYETASSLVYGYDTHIYVAGQVVGDSDDYDFTVISLYNSGVERWLYQYDRCSESDYALSICYGGDGNIYAAGLSVDSSTGGDFTVISLTSGPGIRENSENAAMKDVLRVAPNPFRERVTIALGPKQLPADYEIELQIYDSCGRLVNAYELQTSTRDNKISWYGDDFSGRRLPAGVYFLKFKVGDYRTTEKLLLIR